MCKRILLLPRPHSLLDLPVSLSPVSHALVHQPDQASSAIEARGRKSSLTRPGQGGPRRRYCPVPSKPLRPTAHQAGGRPRPPPLRRPDLSANLPHRPHYHSRHALVREPNSRRSNRPCHDSRTAGSASPPTRVSQRNLTKGNERLVLHRRLDRRERHQNP